MGLPEIFHPVFPLAVVVGLHDVFFQTMCFAVAIIFVKHAHFVHEKKHCTKRKNYHVNRKTILNIYTYSIRDHASRTEYKLMPVIINPMMAETPHLSMLDLGVTAWNTWREENPDIKPDLSSVDLTGRNLGGINLRDTDLRDAYLTVAEMDGAILDAANLSGANLTGVDLTNASLIGADLSNVDLSYATCTFARMEGVILTGARLIETIFFSARMRGADLSNAYLREAIFAGADLSLANFEGAELVNLTLDGATLPINMPPTTFG